MYKRQELKALRIIKRAEDCLIRNAFNKTQNDLGIPLACVGDLSNINDEKLRGDLMVDLIAFKKDYHEPQKTMSKKKKLLIGGAVVVVIGGVAFFAAPIIAPGTVIAAKSTAVASSIKSATVASMGLIKSALTKAPVVVAEMSKELIVVAQNEIERLAELSMAEQKELSAALSLSGLFTMFYISKINEQEADEEIAQLKARASFVDQLRATYPNNNLI